MVSYNENLMLDEPALMTRIGSRTASSCKLADPGCGNAPARAIKRAVRPMLGFKSFWAADIIPAGIELMHMICKGQLRTTSKLHPAWQFYS